MSIDLRSEKLGEKYLNKFVGWQDNKVYRITKVIFEDCNVQNMFGRLESDQPDVIDIVARMNMTQILTEHYEYESGRELLHEWITRKGHEDGSYADYECEEIELTGDK